MARACPKPLCAMATVCSANAWCYGLGMLAKQPFMILRQRQNVENRGGYPFSLLLDPGEAVWERFEWNGAAVVAAILAHPGRDVLIQTPERCTADTLERIVSELMPLRQILGVAAR